MTMNLQVRKYKNNKGEQEHEIKLRKFNPDTDLGMRRSDEVIFTPVFPVSIRHRKGTSKDGLAYDFYSVKVKAKWHNNEGYEEYENSFGSVEFDLYNPSSMDHHLMTKYADVKPGTTYKYSLKSFVGKDGKPGTYFDIEPYDEEPKEDKDEAATETQNEPAQEAKIEAPSDEDLPF